MVSGWLFRPRTSNGQKEYMIASQSVALIRRFTIERDVAPGEAVYIDVQGNLHAKVCGEPGIHAPVFSSMSTCSSGFTDGQHFCL